MARNVRTTFVYVLTLIVFLVSVYHHLSRRSISDHHLRRPNSPASFDPHPYILNVNAYTPHDLVFNQAIHEENPNIILPHKNSLPPPPLIIPSHRISSVSFLFPDWEVLVVVSPEDSLEIDTNRDQFSCVFDTRETSTARPAWVLRSPDRITFKCVLPTRARRRLPFFQPMLVKSSQNPPPAMDPSPPELLRWNYVVYDSFTAEDDVFLFVKGMNNRQGINRRPTEFRCVFGDGGVNAVRTAVTSSLQEVFRCQRPELTAITSPPIKVSLEIAETKEVVPSIAYYTPTRKVENQEDKFELCAATMVYNVAKFLKEWVVYHSKIGVKKFILYDNGSDDDFGKVVNQLIEQGYNVEKVFWLWPKTQEAGFSHSALHANTSCKWMLYVDVDEFVYSPPWSDNSDLLLPSKSLLQSLLPKKDDKNSSSSGAPRPRIGQVMLSCYEFGPSNQKSHPLMGVTQGYNCRKRTENRHKSIVLLDAIHDSLLNVIHHFKLKEGYKMKKLNIQQAAVNHYKFQAWPEFKAKFRRRVSAYVVDWTQTVNPNSNDRTPGLGFSPVEPKGWSDKFCEVYDNGLKELTRRWFGIKDSASEYHMAWQR